MYSHIFSSHHILHCTSSDCSDCFNLQRYNFFHSLIESFLIGQDWNSLIESVPILTVGKVSFDNLEEFLWNKCSPIKNLELDIIRQFNSVIWSTGIQLNIQVQKTERANTLSTKKKHYPQDNTRMFKLQIISECRTLVTLWWPKRRRRKAT